jgi:hypothetical protein
MYQLRRGKKPLSFGRVEAKTSLNWASLVTSLIVALLSWAGAELLPQLDQYGGTVAMVAGLVAQLIPMVVQLLRNNQDVTLEDKKLDSPKKKGK